MFEVEPYVFSDAVKYFWSTRSKQAADQENKGVSDQGTRSAVTGGKQMDGFCIKIVQLIKNVGVPERDVYFKSRMELPGFYRPTKKWDLIIKDGKHLLAAIEFKSQVGSFGNNVNNRAEEAIGNAVDLWTAYREKAFDSSQPWLGFFFLLQDCQASREKGGRLKEPHFPVFPEFKEATYATRYEILCRKLLLERQYNGVCFLMADQAKSSQKENYTEPANDLSATVFVEQLLRKVARACG